MDGGRGAGYEVQGEDSGLKGTRAAMQFNNHEIFRTMGCLCSTQAGAQHF